jgi:bacterioferritin-associated ferredoxin
VNTKKLLCICQQVSYSTIAKIVRTKNIGTLNELIVLTGVSTGCGKCFGQASRVFATERSKIKQTTLLTDPLFRIESDLTSLKREEG